MFANKADTFLVQRLENLSKVGKAVAIRRIIDCTLVAL